MSVTQNFNQSYRNNYHIKLESHDNRTLNKTKNGHFKAIHNEKEAGRTTYTWAGTDKFIIDHTEVNPDFAGQNVGKKMVLEAVQYARENNLKILPLCPFAKSVFDKTKDIQDLLF